MDVSDDSVDLQPSMVDLRDIEAALEDKQPNRERHKAEAGIV
jgi:hypothetical protein